MSFPIETAGPRRAAPTAVDVRPGDDVEDFFENSSIALHIVDPEGVIVRANRAELAMLGYAAEEYIGQPVARFHADPEVVSDILDRLRRGETIRDRPARLLRKDGRICHVRIDSSGAFRHGAFHHSRCMTRDVTAQVEALARQRDLYEALVNAQSELGDGVIFTDGRTVEWVNDAYCRIVGFPREEVLAPGWDPYDRLPPEELPAAAVRERDRASGARSSDRYEMTLLRKDGSRVRVEVAVKALRSGERPPRVAIVRDVTERARQEEALREQRDLYEALLRATSDLDHGLVLTTSMRPVYATEAVARMLGVSVEDLLSRDFDAREYMAPGELERLQRELGVQGGASSGDLHYVVTLKRKDGTLFPAEIVSTGLSIRGVPHRLAVVRDLTAERRSEEALDAARRRLAMTEKLAALGGLVSGVAHEIRTPLTIIRTNLHVLRKRAESARERKDYTALAEILPTVTADADAAIERAEALVRSLRRLLKAEPTTVPASLAPIVREAVDLFVAANRSRVRVVADLAATPRVLVDAAQVQQVVLNLLDNAANASERSREPVSVRTFVSPDGKEAGLVVEDRGVGMTADVQERMYDPLFTTRPDGMGLGLSIVHRIVTEHDGRIACDSSPGKGTRFTVTFPVVRP